MKRCVYCRADYYEGSAHPCPVLMEWENQLKASEVALRNWETERASVFGVPIVIDPALPDNVVLFRRPKR